MKAIIRQQIKDRQNEADLMLFKKENEIYTKLHEKKISQKSNHCISQNSKKDRKSKLIMPEFEEFGETEFNKVIFNFLFFFSNYFQVELQSYEQVKVSLAKTKKDMHKKIKAEVVLRNTPHYSKKLSQNLCYANQTESDYRFKKKQIIQKQKKNMAINEIPLMRSRQKISPEQQNFLIEFGKNFKGKNKFEEMQKSWRKNFNDPPVGRTCFYNYTKSIQKEIIRAFNNDSITF